MGKAQGGATLIEAILTLAFLGMIFVPLSEMAGIGNEASLDAEMIKKAYNLAQDLMEEISAKAFEDPDEAQGSFGNDGEMSRDQFDDVDDYSVWAPNNPPEDVDKNPLNDYLEFTRNVTVINIVDIGPGTYPRVDLTEQLPGSTGFKLVTVTVSWNSGDQVVTLERVVAR